MSIVSVDLPVPLTDGVGAAQVVTSLGYVKAAIVSGVFGDDATIIIEASGAAAGANNFVAVAATRKPGIIPMSVCARRMRVRVVGVLPGVSFAPEVDVAAAQSSVAPSFGEVVPPAGDGVGADLDVSTIPEDRTLFVTGAFTGVLKIFGSQDGVNWAQVYETVPGGPPVLFSTTTTIVKFLHAVRQATDPSAPGLPVIFLGGVSETPAAAIPDPLDLPGGSAAAPALTFGFADTGFFGPGDGEVDFSSDGSVAVKLTGQGVGVLAGLVGTPGLFVQGDTNTGFFAPGADQLSMTAGGTEILRGTTQGVGVLAGLVGTPGLFVQGDVNTGFFAPGADQISMTAGGTEILRGTTQGVGVLAGLVGTPGLFVQGDTNTGFWAPAADTLAVAVGGVENVRFSTVNALFNQRAMTTPFALTYVSAGTTAVDASKSNVFTVTLANATTLLGNPSNLVAGQSFLVVVTQDGTGGRAMTFDTSYSFGIEGAPDLTTSALNIVDVISCLVVSGTKIACTVLRGF